MSVSSLAARLAADLGQGPLFVHSDPFRTARLVPASRDRRTFLDSHVALLREIAGTRTLVIPGFNYDFPRTRRFDVAQDPVQLGPIPEHFRTTVSAWRTSIPIFSVCGIGEEPPVGWGEGTDPFGGDSVFAWLVDKDAVVMYYGDTFHYNTIVHHAERVAGGPLYRYDKIFSGTVRMADGTTVAGSLDYHVRPLGKGLEYDWPRLLDEALAAGVCRRVEGRPEVLAASARELCALWVENLRSDPLSLLDAATLEWVRPELEKLGRRFEIGDFEAPVEPTGLSQ
jgi:aminoglycoside 3-N-acetyltransferase